MSSVPVHFILFCSQPLPHQLILLLGAFAINATKFFLSGFLVPEHIMQPTYEKHMQTATKRKEVLLNCCVQKTKHVRLLDLKKTHCAKQDSHFCFAKILENSRSLLLRHVAVKFEESKL